jgi:antitoxin VapB
MAYTGRACLPISTSREPREAKLFRNNRSQAVRIPAEFELPGDRVLISRDGDRLIIEATPKSCGLIALLDRWEPLDENFPDVDEHLPPLRDVEL